MLANCQQCGKEFERRTTNTNSYVVADPSHVKCADCENPNVAASAEDHSIVQEHPSNGPSVIQQATRTLHDHIERTATRVYKEIRQDSSLRFQDVHNVLASLHDKVDSLTARVEQLSKKIGEKTAAGAVAEAAVDVALSSTGAVQK